ncbi:MAG: hypothetical protein ACI4V5_07225 [Prevotella sp.]
MQTGEDGLCAIEGSRHHGLPECVCPEQVALPDGYVMTWQGNPQIMQECLKAYSEHIKAMPMMITGDSNCYIGQDGVSKQTGTFEQCIAYMREIHLYQHSDVRLCDRRLGVESE